MSKIKEKWKKLKYWQKGGIVLGVFHIIFYSIILFLMYIEIKVFNGRGEFVYLLIPLEYPTLIITKIIISPFLNFKISLYDFAAYNWMFGFALGTATWLFFGIIIGYSIDLIKYFRGDKIWEK